jgi:uncharacterized iron-regulated membrane protein
LKLRKLVLNVHLVAGLTVGLLLVSAGLTGSLLVFRAEIDTLLAPHLLRVEPAGERVAVERVLGSVRAAFPGEAPLRVQMPREAEETFEVTLAGEAGRMVYVHPYTGAVLGTRLPTDHFAGWLFEWHTKLLSGETGERVMGTAALVLLVLVLTGVVVWWPGMRRLADGFRVKWRAGWKRVNFDLHRAGGIWTTAFLTAVSVTGASLVFHDAFMATLNRATRSEPRPTPPVVAPVAAAPLSVDALIARADRRLPGGQVTYLTLPATATAPLVVRKRFDYELHPNGRNFVYLHPQTGEVLALEEARTAPAGTRAYNVLYPIHIGRWGGTVTRVLYALLGLAPLVLFVSGCLMWWNRVLAPKRRRKAREREARGGRRGAESAAAAAVPAR